MKLTCRAGDLALALGRAVRIVPSRTMIPIFHNALLEAGDAGLQLTTLNASLSVTSTIEATISQPGRTTVPAKTLADYVGLLPAASSLEFSLARGGASLRVASDTHNAKFATLDADEFPRAAEAMSTGISIDAQALEAALELVLFAAAPDDTRPVLAGVLVRLEGGALTLAAADGFRLAIRTIGCDGANPDCNWIVPSAALREVLYTLAGTKAETCRFAPTFNQQLMLEVGSVRLVSRLVDGQFPDYARFATWTRDDSVVTTECDRSSLLDAVRLAALFNEFESRRVWLVGSESTPGLQVEATGAELGGYRTTIDATPSRAPFEVAFNSRYLKDVLERLKTPRVGLEVGLDQARGRTLLRPVGELDGGGNYVHAVMAMHGTRPQTPAHETDDEDEKDENVGTQTQLAKVG